jgi:hypothetical protein
MVRSIGGKKIANQDRAKYQMGRIAVHFTKAILTAAEAHPHALFGFMELQGPWDGEIPPTAGEMGIERLAAMLPEINLPQLKSDDEETIEGEVHAA